MVAVDSEPPDLYAIGFQELDLSKEAFVFNESVRERDWTEIARVSLHLGLSKSWSSQLGWSE